MRSRNPFPRRCLAACLAVALAVAGCSKVSPVAPSGTTLTLSANPSFISSGSGTSTITALVRKPNGTPVANGTEVRFTVDLGTIDSLVTTGSGGVATATLRGDGRLGKATVSAFVGGGSTATTLVVNIGGLPPTAKTIILQADPPSVSTSGTTGNGIKLLALVRDSSGVPEAGAGVNFSSPIGTLRSGGGIVVTNSQGEAIDFLTVTAGELISQTAPFTVTAETPASDGSLLSATFMVQVLTTVPVAAFHVVQQTNSFTVQFVNDSTPTSGLNFMWNFGDGTSSTDVNPSHTYPSTTMTYVVSLVATNGTGQSSVATQSVTVPGK
jgi:hypothetical protein